jgi:hypothetical protein
MGVEAGGADDTAVPTGSRGVEMPNGVYPVPRFRARPPHAIPLGVRLRVWWHRVELDERLASGEHPADGTLLRRRAEQLASRGERARLAQALSDTLREAGKPAPIHGGRLPLRRRQIRACQDDILALIQRLADGRPIDVQGAAMVCLLLFDGAGPLYRAGDVTLRFRVRSARLSLDHSDELAPTLPMAA